MLNLPGIPKFSKKEALSGSDSKKRLEVLKQLAKIKVFSNTEIFVFVLLFIVLAAFLFPRGELTEAILNGKENLNFGLSRVYIESLLKIKKDPKLIMVLIKNDIKSGNVKEAEKLLQELEKLKNSPISKEELLKLKLAILEEKYALASPDSKNTIKKQIKNTIKYLVVTNFNPETIKKIYNEALKLGFIDIAYIAADKLAAADKNPIIWHKKAFKLAVTLKNYDEAFKHIDFLINHSRGSKKIKFLQKAFNLSVAIGNYDRGYLYGEHLLKSKNFSRKDVNTLINMALAVKDYNSAFKYAYEAFKTTGEKYYFKKAIQIALWAGKKELVKHLITKYGMHYLNDPDMTLFLLKTSMALNDRNLSQQLASEAVKIYGGKR
ncbi:tetratricopeptide repeat protein [Desulfurobacterium indicum]|uniref:Uncharacterized protein n=1 Tax=Desulfurobacterium indicum TaxID=1914305 RepID=A0A1R1MN11_9BACT|nr:tetratricopeptide repeat protein [Desulfurobacterium indicum]OMH41208.1 hypothetical protein BLW93_01575 [Desulfurobacterium indicum]